MHRKIQYKVKQIITCSITIIIVPSLVQPVSNCMAGRLVMKVCSVGVYTTPFSAIVEYFVKYLKGHTIVLEGSA